MSRPSGDARGPTAVRLDKWLWAARFFKTRALAAEAVGGGKVQLNGSRVKRSKPVHVGDRIRIRKGPYEYQLEVVVVSEHRGSAADAALLYSESEASRHARERMRDQHRLAAKAASAAGGPGRPTKKQRRQIDRLKGRT